MLKADDQPADLLVETRYEHADADRLRGRLRRESRDEIERAYLKFYADRHPGILSAGHLEATDDLALNVITTREHYTIPDFYAPSDDRSRRQISLSATAVQDVLPIPALRVERHLWPCSTP